jgi:protein tyrosine phosphatase (PTP) superfamily phosphohydrolase (DUF442 family)
MSKNRILGLGFFIALSSALTGIACYGPACGSKEYVNIAPAPILESGGQSFAGEFVNQNKNGATNHQWAAKIDLLGVPNFHKVSEDLYRGAQPSAEGFGQLEKLGIKTVVNLRSFHSDRNKLKGTNLNYEHISMTAWHPENEDVMRFLKIVTDANLTPVFVHCQHGADRTGTMCAIYRIAVQGWPKDEAIEEMTKGDFGFHGVWDNLVHYIHGLDIEKIKQHSGIKQPITNN